MRSESQPQYGRRRSNTAQSILRPIQPVPPLQIGDSTVLNAWVHDPKETANVIFNHSYWPGVVGGDVLSVSASNGAESDAFLLIVPKEDDTIKSQLQISIPKPIADSFGLRNNSDVVVTKVDKEEYCADYVEFVFQDQYLGRNDMWRLGKHLVGRCVYADEEVSFVGNIVAKIQCIYIAGRKVSAAIMTSRTKAIYRSLSAKLTIFIQVCRELWEFAGDGERYNEKIVHSFLPALFAKWREAGTNHTVTIVLISRVYYDESEIDYAAGPLRCDEEGQWFKDFYKVITDLDVKYEWETTLVSLKNSFWDFQRDILLTHHYHRAVLDSALGSTDQVRLVGRISYAHDGPILEALNITLNPTETHYIDRSLTLTGAATIVVTPGTGYYRVSKQLLRLTTTRMLDQGIGLDLICLAKPPLHQSPVFSFQGYEPDAKTDPLWGGDDTPATHTSDKQTFFWEPFWVSVSWWDKQMDLPFRQDRFIARAKMHEIQMLGLLEHDVLSSIEVPFLPDPNQRREGSQYDARSMEESGSMLSRAQADEFDQEIFAINSPSRHGGNLVSPIPMQNAAFSPTSDRTLRSTPEKRYSQRSSIIAPTIQLIEESPRIPTTELPQNENRPETVVAGTPGTSPSQSSLRSTQSNQSSKSSAALSKTTTRSILSSKLTPWLSNPFRSKPSQPQTSPIAVSALASPISSASSTLTLATSSPTRILLTSQSPAAPMTIKPAPGRSTSSRPFEDDPGRVPIAHQSPANTPPRDEAKIAKRRNVLNLNGAVSSSPAVFSNPSKPTSVSQSHRSLASRWQHTFPRPVYKYDIKWLSLVTPACLPLTVEYFPSTAELETLYDVFSYDFVVDPIEMGRSFLVKPPAAKGDPDTMRRAWALVVMQGMAAVRLAQGFQFVLRCLDTEHSHERKTAPRRLKSFVTDDDMVPKAAGASEVLKNTDYPVFLSMTNEIHRISYTGEAIQVTRYVRRMSKVNSFDYTCLMWPKLGVGYTEQSMTFTRHGLENYGWNRLDMLVAGYEHQFNESLRYWRTRFVVIPTSDPPLSNIGPSGEKLNDEETRILGIEKLAEHFTKLRWQPPEEVTSPAQPVRFLPTTLNPAISVLDETLMNQLDQIHAAGPLRKKMKSEREIADMSLAAIVKAMREEDGVPIKYHQWHGAQYPDSFTGSEFVSWLVREFRDVSSRAQGTEWGVKLTEQGLLEHCRGYHNFLDGHYFYRLKGEYAVPSTPRGWFRARHSTSDDAPRTGFYPGNTARVRSSQSRRNKKRLILSQTMVIDIDPNKRSDQAEAVILHHDIIHNPATVFHFELQWIGTTARYIEEQLRQWSKTIERYGLKLVETYVTQISDIRERNAFQSCFPLRLAVPPPIVPDLHERVPEGTQTTRYFEYALLQKFDFIIDVEAADLYPEHVDVVYSYRRSPFKYSQFVHRSGVAFIQVLGGARGFLFLTNRLIGPGRMGATTKNKEYRPSVASAGIRRRMQQFCSDKAELIKFYDEVLDKLKNNTVDEPPPLSI